MHVISLLLDSYAIHVDFNKVQIKFNSTAALIHVLIACKCMEVLHIEMLKLYHVGVGNGKLAFVHSRINVIVEVSRP